MKPADARTTSPTAGWYAVAKQVAVLRAFSLSLVSTLVVVFVTQFGLPARLETAIADQVAFRDKKAPSRQTVLITVDDTVIKKTAKFPIDRKLLADALDRIAASGAKRVYVDSALTTAESPDVDAALDKAIAALGRERLSLTTLRVNSADGTDLILPPLERFARNVTVTSPMILFDPDRRARRIGVAGSGQEQATTDWLKHGESRTRTQALPVDFSINMQGIVRFNLIEAADGIIPAKLLEGATVIIGNTLITPQSVIHVPIYGRLSRVEVLALASETMIAGRTVYNPTLLERTAIVFAMTLAFALALQQLGLLAGLLLLISAGTFWFSQLAWMQQTLGTILPALAPPLACFVVWQSLKLRDSALAHKMQGLYTRLVGVGKNALVMAVDVIGDPAVVLDRSGQLVGANGAFRDLARAAFPAVRDPMALSLADIFGEQAEAVQRGLAGNMPNSLETSLVIAGAEKRHFEASLRSIDTVTGRLALASLKDVTESRARVDELTNLAFRDALTGLSNRSAFHARLHSMGEKPDQPFAILLIDLDGFKKVNDTLGHHAGDLLLVGVAGRIQALLGPGDMAARLGGDEFAVLLAKTTADAACTVAQGIINALKPSFDVDGQDARVGASIGIAVWPDHHHDAHEALKLADAAMYAAKRNKPAYALHSEQGHRLVACA